MCSALLVKQISYIQIKSGVIKNVHIFLKKEMGGNETEWNNTDTD